MRSSILILLFVGIPALAGSNDPARQKSEGGAGLPGEAVAACMERLNTPKHIKANGRALRCDRDVYASCMKAFNKEQVCNRLSPNEKK